MEQSNQFSEGLFLDKDPQYQPADSYRHAQNLLLTAGGHLLQEGKATLLASRPPYPTVGATVLGTDEILFSTDGTSSAIGVQNGDTYTNSVSLDYAFGSFVSCTAHIDYRGHRLVYFGDGLSYAWIDLDAPTPAVSPVIPNPELPEVDVLRVGNSGELPTGIYLASVGLVTASKNSVSYSPFSNPVPIVNEALDSGHSTVDGAAPQTVANGSITFRLTHLPTNYAYVQLIIATYVGLSNQLQLQKLPLIAINNRTSIDYTYYSATQHVSQVELSEVLSTLADFEKAGAVLQKDGRLLAANVQMRKKEDVDWQAIANNIILGPSIKEVPYLEETSNPQDYKDPMMSVHGKGLQRGEVYSFCFTPVVRGRKLDAYHIPGIPYYLSGSFDTYYSSELYPENSGYVADANGNKAIRHHRMPPVSMEPLVTNMSEGAATLRILGAKVVVEPDFSQLPAELLADLDGYYIGMQPREGANRSILAQGICQPLVPIQNGYHAVSAFNGKWPAVKDDSTPHPSGNGAYGAFYSPETDIIKDSVAGATKLTCIARLDGKSKLVASELAGDIQNRYAYAFLNFTSLTNSTAGGDIPLLTTTNSAITGSDDYAFPIGEGAISIYTWQQNGYTLLQADRNFYTDGFYTGLTSIPYDLQYNNRLDRTDEIYIRQPNGTYKNQSDASEGVTWRYLYNLVHPRTAQYGNLEQATYYTVHFQRKGEQVVPFYNGDTFIGKVALQSNTAEYENGDNHGIVFRTLNYYFCESTVNTSYRHTVPATQSTTGTAPYYPKLSVLFNSGGTGVMQYNSSLGQPNGYNKQYSFTNRLTPLFPKDTTIEEVTSFTNRIYYSEQSVEGEQLDAFRIFKANNYHDIPKDKGPISLLWTWMNSLYIHTTQALYKGFFNETSTVSTSEGETYLGNGGIFNRPSMPVYTVDGGFAGCQDPRASVTTPVGHFFPDREGKREYLFSGQLEDISRKGMRDWFTENFPNSPSLTAGYDYQNERYILYGINRQAISFCMRTGKWTSFHTQKPSFALGTQRRYLLDLNSEGGLSVGNSSTALPSSLTVICNSFPEESKVFDNVYLSADKLPATVQQKTLSQETIAYPTVPYTTYGQEDPEETALVRFANDQYQYPVGRDSNQGRLKGKWGSITHNWTSGQPALITKVTTLFRKVFR
jgi:hypothetical protein